jgi:hypothetical protein
MWTDDHIRFSVWDEHFLVARNNDEVLLRSALHPRCKNGLIASTKCSSLQHTYINVVHYDTPIISNVETFLRGSGYQT